jgi:hypothetical protein
MTSARFILALALISTFLGPWQPVQADSPMALPSAPSENPTPIAAGVSQFTTAGQVFYWSTEPQVCTPGDSTTYIRRTRTTGWEPRTVFERFPFSGPCPYRLYSNLMADAQYLYWVAASGLVRFPLDAHPLSDPETILAYPGEHSELVMDETHIYGYNGGHLWRVEKANPANNSAIGYNGPETARNLQWDGTSLFMIWGPDNWLIEYPLGGASHIIASGVASYVATGPELICQGSPPTCAEHRYTYYTAGHHLLRYNHFDGGRDTVYISTPPTGQVSQIYAVTAAEPSVPTPGLTRDVFFFEKRWIPGGGFVIPSDDFLVRLRSGVGAPDTLYHRITDTTWHAAGLRTGDDFLWWNDYPSVTAPDGTAQRLPIDAEAIPVINMRVTDMQVTQGIQRSDYGNRVLLVRDRHTYVRVMVRSDGPDVPNVSALLTAYWGGEPQEHLRPVTNTITVRQTPTDTLQTNFLFALPLEWTHHNDLILEAHLNPFGFPPEPTYADNKLSIGSLAFLPPPRHNFHILQVSYPWRTASGTTVLTATNDFDAITSWLYRAFPLGLEPGQAVATQGAYFDAGLGARIQDFNTLSECQYLLETRITFPPLMITTTDSRELCASYYLNDELARRRQEGALPQDAYIYASVVGLPRGSEAGGPPVSNGPSRLAEGTAFHLAGYYAGHELGHLLGRGHPNAQSDNPNTPAKEGCEHNPGDALFPYASAGIGDANTPTSGFDSGWNVPGGGRRLLRWSDAVRDVMSYCLREKKWLSDYTYEGIYLWLNRNPSPPAAAGAAETAHAPAQRLNGDFLQVTGRVQADGLTGAFTTVRRLDSLAEAPVPVPGDYVLRLVAVDSGPLAVHAFTPQAADSAGWRSFLEVVPFVDGAAEVQVVNAATGAIVARQAVSPQAPVVSGVGFGGAAEPLEGTVSLAWTAADADGDALTFDVLYSRDGGASFELLQANVPGSSASLDTAQVPGGTLVFRVRASDGVNTGYADSPPVQVAAKPPQPTIMLPSGGTHSQYGQAIQLAGHALDAQDGPITSLEGLTWLTARVGDEPQVVGSGPTLSLRDLDPGTHVVRLTATNSLGLSGSTELLLTVSDDLSDPPPALAVSPSSAGWQVENGETAVQTAQVTIFNGGGLGALDWTASSDAAWLALDAAAGTGEAVLTLSAATDGLAANSALAATVTITANHAGGQETVHVPVLLQVGAGDVWAPPTPQVLSHHVLIPLVTR